MLRLNLQNARTILCIGAHPDDIEIGCGGTLLKLLSQHDHFHVHWVVLSGCERRSEEARKSASEFLANAREAKIVVKRFRDSFFPYVGEEIKEYFFELRRECEPDLIFTHRREDQHQDHRQAAELTWNTFREHLILEYEIPKYEGDLGSPNVLFALDEATCHRKIEILLNAFPTQRARSWFTADTFWSLLRLRGIETASSRYAEGHHCRKLLF